MESGAEGILAPDATTVPFWWQDAPPEPADDRPLPERVEVAIIGGGYCGLAAALELARAGVGVAALDAGPLGAGASTRNGGMVGGAVKLDWHGLAGRVGPQRATALLDGAEASFAFLEELIARERLDAAYERCGRLLLACHPAPAAGVRAPAARRLAGGSTGARLVPRAAPAGGDRLRPLSRRRADRAGGRPAPGALPSEPRRRGPGGRRPAARPCRGAPARARRPAGFALETARGRVQARPR